MTDSDTATATKLAPAPLATELRERMLRAMQETETEVTEDLEMECRLAQLQPAPLPAALYERYTRQMQTAQRSTAHRPYSSRLVWRMAATAGVILLGVCGVSTTLQSIQGEDAAQGLVRRSVLARSEGNTIQWEGNDTALRQYEVMYEDSFVLTGDDDTTLVIRVPNRTTVSVWGEVI